MIEEHLQKVSRISQQIVEFRKLDKHIRFFHGGTNSTRTQINKLSSIDISDLNQIIEINKKEKYIIVEPNVPMDLLLDATLKEELVPFIIPEFPGITCGGAVSGTSLESSSWKYGQFNDCCEEYEVILGNGEIVKASITENSDLFYGISGAYGTLGLITQIKIKLRDAKQYVKLVYEQVSTEKAVIELENRLAHGNFDYIESIIFDKERAVIITGTLADQDKQTANQTFFHKSDPWFYEHAKSFTNTCTELVPITDYIFRYNRGAFWMGEYFFSLLNLPNSSYLKKLLNPFMNTRKLYSSMHAFNMGHIYFLQDFYCPIENAQEFIDFIHKELNIYPLWLCPIKPTNSNQKLSPHFIQDTKMLIDVGVWGKTKKYRNSISVNRLFEEYLLKVNGRKMLYAYAYYTKNEFWSIYDYEWYKNLTTKYKAMNVFPEVWGKVHVSDKSNKIKVGRGISKMLLEWIKGKNLNT